VVAIKNQRLFRWRNQICHHPVATAELVFDEAESWAPEQLAAARELIAETWPEVSPRKSGPGIEDFMIWVALTVQLRWDVAPPLAEITRDPASGARLFCVAYGDRNFAHAPADAAVVIANALGREPGVNPATLLPLIQRMEERLHRVALHLTTRVIVRGAVDRGAYWTRVATGLELVGIGMGAQRRKVRRSILSGEGALEHGATDDKFAALEQMEMAGIPVGSFALARNEDQAVAAAEHMGYPVALKSVFGYGGKQVSPYLTDPAAVRKAADKLLAETAALVVQSFFPGDDYRLLVIDGRFVAGSRRIPAEVVGDGTHSLRALIDLVNNEPRRGKDLMRTMYRIEVDETVKAFAAEQGLSLYDVPEAGRVVRLRRTANMATGGTLEEVTHMVHPDNARMAEWAAASARSTARPICEPVGCTTPSRTWSRRSWKPCSRGAGAEKSPRP
jgi:D-alanine-D-alanine ligase-like ATP-grasp enzyme